jgi:PadR family transcriptional regulator, regulatory protein AphA
MTLQFALLGLLSWQPCSGYDLKKIISGDALYYWSGNNNQIYKTLIQLHHDGLVQSERYIQESLPAKKVYTLTAQGRAALEEWVRSDPELPEFRSTFLIQLSWAGFLGPADLDGLLERYEDEVGAQAAMLREKARRQALAPRRSALETHLWQSIAAHRAELWQLELGWVRRLREELSQTEKESEERT